MAQDGKVARFIHGDRVVTVIDVPDDELDALIASMVSEVEAAYEQFLEEEAAKPGFINDCRE